MVAWKGNQSTRALARLRRKGESASVQSYERGGDGQPEPSPSALLLGGEERIAQACEILRRNAASFVAYRKHYTAFGSVKGGGHGDPVLPVGQRLQGVGQEIHHDLLHVLRIAPHGR